MKLAVSKRMWIRAAVGGTVFTAICMAAYLLGQHQQADSPPWYSIVPPLLAVTLALVANRLFLCLASAVIAGGLLGTIGGSGNGFLKASHYLGTRFVYQAVDNTDNQLILAYVVLILATISVVLVSGGLQGVANWLARFARSARSTRIVTVAMGLVIFIDDYANTMIVGATMRPVTDRQRISREKLAFLIDATAAPVAGIALISTWVGYEVGLLATTAGLLGIAQDGYSIFLDALGCRFYCLMMIVFVVFQAYWGVDFGPMAKAERRAQSADHPVGPTAIAADTATLPSGVKARASVAVVPMAVLLIVFLGRLWFDAGGGARPVGDLVRFDVWREVFSEINSIPLLAYASAVGFVVAMLLALLVARLPVLAMLRGVVLGLKGSLLPMTILILAWSLKETCESLQTGTFLANALADWISPTVFPALVFVIAGVTAFSTGTSWGTMAIMIPTALPVAFRLDGDVYGPITVLGVAAILDGAIFGDHCSPISDTTIMSSTASGCDHLAHVRTQMPYSMVVGAIALCAGYIPVALGASQWVGLGGGIALIGLLLLAVSRIRR